MRDCAVSGDQWSKVEGVEQLDRLGPTLRKAVSVVEAAGEPSITFSLFGPTGTPPSTVTSCFALVEKEFFTKNKGELRVTQDTYSAVFPVDHFLV